MDIADLRTLHIAGKSRLIAGTILVKDCNNFRVIDVKKFKAAMKPWPWIEVVSSENDHDDEVTLYCGDNIDVETDPIEHLHWPREDGNWQTPQLSFEFLHVISTHLRPKQKALLTELSYIGGTPEFIVALIPASGAFGQTCLSNMTTRAKYPLYLSNHVYYPGDDEYEGKNGKPWIPTRYR